MILTIWNIRFFSESIYMGKINIDEAEMNQTNLLENMRKFNNNSRPQLKEDKEKKRYFWKWICSFLWRSRINS